MRIMRKTLTLILVRNMIASSQNGWIFSSPLLLLMMSPQILHMTMVAQTLTGQNLNGTEEEENNTLILPSIDVNSLNEDQRFAFSLVMETLIKYQENPVGVEKLRVIIPRTAGSGKSYLIQSLVRAIKLLFNSNKAVQVLCPTGSSAILISGRTIHSFLKIPTSTKATKEMSPPDGVTGIVFLDDD